MPRELRLSLPDAPGVYRLQRTGGSVLYVGKASSLHHRVNSYFRHQRGVPERMLEMLSQVRDLSFEVTPSALEAALLEPDEIKRHRPPYNLALTDIDRHVWFTSLDLSERSPLASARCPVGPFPSAELLDQFAAFAHANSTALGSGRWAPDAAVWDAGYASFCAAHAELSPSSASRNGDGAGGDAGGIDAGAIDAGAIDAGGIGTSGVSVHSRLLRLGTRLWREGRRDRDVDLDTDVDADVAAANGSNGGPMPTWTPERVHVTLEWLALRAAHARRRARWLTRLVDATVVWREPGSQIARLIVIEHGEITVRTALEPAADATPPIPPGHGRSIAARHEGFTIARLDRLRVLTTELKRLTAEGAPVAVRFGTAPPLADAGLAYALSWL